MARRASRERFMRIYLSIVRVMTVNSQGIRRRDAGRSAEPYAQTV
jgi:hypothetical protein